jgi:phosphorylase kinase alpha/beta subunit
MDNYAEHKGQAWDSFYHRSPMETTLFIVSALRKLLTVRSAGDDLPSDEITSSEAPQRELSTNAVVSDDVASEASPLETQGQPQQP